MKFQKVIMEILFFSKECDDHNFFENCDLKFDTFIW